MSLHVKTINDAEGGRRVLLLGAGTIEHIADALDAVREGVMSGGAAVIDLAGIEAADMTLLQLICSAHKSARKAGGSVRIEHVPNPVRKAIEGLGFMHNLCGEQLSEPCLWDSPGQEA